EADPGSSNFVFLTRDADGSPLKMYEYNIQQDRWTVLTNVSIPDPATWTGNYEMFSVLAVPIPKYNVIMYMSSNAGSNGKVYIYKHSPGSGTLIPTDTTPPVISAASSSSITSTSATVTSTTNEA